MEELVKGVKLRRAGDFIRQMAHCQLEMRLLETWDGTEVTSCTFRAGSVFSLMPVDGATALEVVYILAGEAVWEQGGKCLQLKPGDFVSGTPVLEPCTLKAISDVTALYVTSQPMWHHTDQYLRDLRSLAVAVEQKDGYTLDHCDRIQAFSYEVGKLFSLTPGRMNNLVYGAYLHDVGKVSVPDAILLKPGRLTAEEWEVMKRHPVTGRDMVLQTVVRGAAQVVEQHHERLDGSGYPHGLRGDEILLESQIVAVADSYDAITTNRVYRSARSVQEAMAELKACSGKLYRPDVVECFLEVIHKTA